MNKKVVFIGGGASSLCSAVLLKSREPSFDITIVEKEKKLGKKLSMTGGGKCNIAPIRDDVYVYNKDSLSLVERLYKSIPLTQYLDLLEEIGIITKTIKEYGFYPIHESAPQVVKNLFHQINKLGIKVVYDEFIDYQSNNDKVIISLKNSKIEADYLVLATGGLSPQMKSVFDKHNVKVTKTLPGLCPVKVKEDVSSLFGCRFEAVITLLYKGNIVKKCYGEVQFKKDGLSGIPVLNYSSEIARRLIKEDVDINDFKISIGLLVDYEPDILGKTIEEVLFSLFREEYALYLISKHQLNKKELVDLSIQKQLLKIIRDERFAVRSLYDFKDSQVSVGGVSLSEIDENFAIKHERNVFISGEALDVDGYCGGYNLRFAITSGFNVVASLIEKFRFYK